MTKRDTGAPFPLDGARCCSDLKLDRYLDDELEAAARVALEQHLASSPVCHARMEQLRADRADFAANAPPRGHAGATVAPATAATVTPISSSRRWSRQAPAAVGALAAAAAVFFFVRGNDPDVDVVRAKGGGALTIEILQRRDGAVRIAESRAPVAPGDRIQFTVRADQGAHVSVIGRDGAGVVSVYAPTIMVPAHVDTRLAGSIELDGTLGEESLFAFFCATPQPVDVLVSAVRAASSTSLPRAEGCGVDPRTLVKRGAQP